ncbi:MAG TPA: gamma carbonic anhydrase family protein [Pirellulaceae bacterium]|mgnify:CR=1 FL=1|nr:gamma carbonic anhydrase family protein [Pirellulaceae bacterium]HMO92629.1 gamma carbonic anhydrase family protein [Pirellulaceae bacterium]HMP70223.1 gamma carbonic anhydrase family protein [Pirellulaceae bacterium]
MALIKTVLDKTPKFGANVYLAENATIIGDVELGNNCSVWFQAVVRGDVNVIRIGDQVNIQDGAIIHGTYQFAATNIGNRVSIGHRAIVHGCTVDDDVLIGMGAIIMDQARLHSNSIIAAGSVVLEKQVIEANSVYAGVPAKKVKTIDSSHLEQIRRIATNYEMYAGWYAC